jgi:hypothetical protein
VGRAAEEERKSPNPMVRVEKPTVPEVVKAFFTEAERRVSLPASKRGAPSA